MGSDDAVDHSDSYDIFGSGKVDAGSHNIDALEVLSSGRQSTHELECASENLTRVELDLTCCSEKLANLDILLMHVASRENDFEAFTRDEEQSLEAHAHKALGFEFLSVFLDCEIQELEGILCTLQTEIVSSSEFISSLEHLGDAVKEMEEKIQDFEYSLQRSFKQVSDIKVQCGEFQRILCASSSGEDGKELGGLENGDLPNSNAEIKMQTAEDQRSVLRMLEESLGREIDLEKKLTESRQTEENLELRLQQEVYYMEQELEDLLEKLFDAENMKEILSGISKELQMKAGEAEKRAENAKLECKILRDSNLLLNNDLHRLKTDFSDATEKVKHSETQLANTEVQRLHAVASAEASQEKQNMLDCTIRDMESLIKDLKSMVSRAETQTEIAEERCIMLSESNAELTEGINFLRHKVENLETSLRQADEAKKQNVKDIRVQTKLIANFVLKLAAERERLQKEVLSLRKEKNVAVKNLQQTRNVPASSSTQIGTEKSGSLSELDIIRNIDARQLKFMNCKSVIRIVLLLGIPSFLMYLFGDPSKISAL